MDSAGGYSGYPNTLTFANSISVLLLSFLFCLWFVQRKKHGAKNQFPGPIGLPIIGHLPFLMIKPEETLLAWKKVHGPIYSINLAGYSVLVLNDPKLVKDAFSLPALSGRPKMPMLKAVGRDKSFMFSDGPHIDDQRRFAIKQLKSLEVAKSIEARYTEEIQELLERFSSESGSCQPIHMNGRFQIATLNALWSLFMGQRFEQNDTRLMEFGRNISLVSKYEGILDKIPYFYTSNSALFHKITGFDKKCAIFDDMYKLLEEEFQKPIPSRIPGQPRNFKEAFMDQMEMDKEDKNSGFHESHNMFPYSAGSIFMASIDTTSTLIDWFVLYMATNPQVQQKMYSELHSSIGISRLPSLSDRRHCPYTEAVTCEIMRISSIIALGAHRAIQDVENFHGFHIPQDTIILPNFWGIHHDPDLWANPSEFIPERFMSPSGQFQKSDNLLPFSTGRRNCIGMDVAKDQLFLAMTSLLLRFQISAPPGKFLSLDRIPGFVISPQPFQILLVDRFKS